jgi:hypothetical protein
MLYKLRCVLGILIAFSFVIGSACWVRAEFFEIDQPSHFGLMASAAYLAVFIPWGLFFILAAIFLYDMMSNG